MGGLFTHGFLHTRYKNPDQCLETDTCMLAGKSLSLVIVATDRLSLQRRVHLSGC
jgi:hypothetical protein